MLKLLDLDLEVYQGPFDLLFTLILKEEVDLCEIRLAEIILAYLEALVEQEGTDWEGLSEFLVLVSSLLELKSRLLLPGQRPDEEVMPPAEAAEQLLQRMLRYRTFKDASRALEDLLAQNGARRLRAAEVRPRRRPSEEEAAGTQEPHRLREAMQALFERREGPDTSHISPARVDLRRQIVAIRTLLRRSGRLSFEQTFGHEPPMTQAVSLFAVLELLAGGLVSASQDQAFGDIVLEAQRARQVA